MLFPKKPPGKIQKTFQGLHLSPVSSGASHVGGALGGATVDLAAPWANGKTPSDPSDGLPNGDFLNGCLPAKCQTKW